MDIVDRMNDKYDELENKLLAIENVYSIMNEIPIPISADDKSSLKSLKAQMNSLAQKIQERIKVQEDVLPHFRKQLELEERQLRETIQDALKEVKNPTLLEAEASIEEIKPTLNKIESVLVQSREKVLRYNGYEKEYAEYGFTLSEYFELVSAEQMLKALKCIWKCVESWDRMYDEWSAMSFEFLDVVDCQRKTNDIKDQVVRAQEIVGENPVSGGLTERVSNLEANLPCLMDLKAKSLKERHWKMISDVVGSDIKVHKVTLGLLDQNNVFNFSHSVVRIVRTAEMEEQLDGLVDNLRRSWTESHLAMTPRHGIPTVEDFQGLYATVAKSLRTLKQLGSSQYSADMRDQLVGWYRTVREAKKAIDVIKTTQNLWLTQDALFTSMPFEEENPSAFAYFHEIRLRLKRDFFQLSQAPSVMVALSNKDLVSSIDDSRLALEDTASEIPNALMAVRVSSPRLFFLADEELLDMLNLSYQNISKMERYLARLFPWFHRLLLVKGTELRVTRRGYNPEVLGIESRDGEIVRFVDTMKARLEVDYWVKCVGLNLRHTLRAHSKSTWKALQSAGGGSFLSKLEALWSDEQAAVAVETAPIQMLVATIHAAWSEFAVGKTTAAEMEEGGVGVKSLFLRLRHKSLNRLTQSCDSEARRARERVKVFLLEYHLHKFDSAELKDPVTYSHDERVGILRVRAFHRTYNYGYEYHAQHVCFSPMLLTERPFHALLKNVVEGYTSRVSHGPRSPLLRQLGLLFGRFIVCFLEGYGQTLENALLGAVTAGSWLIIDGVERMNARDACLLRSLTEKLVVLQQRRALSISDKDIQIRHGVKHQLFLSRWEETLGKETAAFDASRYRQVALGVPSKSLLIKSALRAMGNVSDTVVAELAFVVDEISRSHTLSPSVTAASEMDALQKMLAAIRLSSTSRVATKEIFRTFLALGARSYLRENPRLRRSNAWPGEFRVEMERMLSIDEQVKSSEPDLAGSELLFEAFKELRESVHSFPVTTIINSDYGNMLLRRCVRLLKARAIEGGSEVLSLCAESQLSSEEVVLQLKRALFLCKKDFLLIVEGRASPEVVTSIAHLGSEYGIRKLKVLFTESSGGDATVAVNRLRMPSDECLAIATLLAHHWGRERCRPTKLFNDFMAAISAASRILCSLGEPVYAEAIATTVGLQTKEEPEGESDPLRMLLTAVTFNLLPSKTKAFLAQAKEDLSIRALATNSEAWDDFGEAKAKASEAELKPQLSIDHGNTDLFVPTKETARVVGILNFCLSDKMSVILYGRDGAGKTTAIGKMLEMLPKQSRVIFLRLGKGPMFEQEDAILRSSDINGETIVVLEGFRFDRPHHVAFVESLIRGRYLFDRQQDKFVQIKPLTLCVEALYKESGGGNEFEAGLRRTRVDLVPIHMRKPFDDDAHILTSAMSIFAKDFSEEIQAHIQEVKSFIIGWHKFMKNKFPPITDHVLYRLVSGLLLANPEEVSSVRHLNSHLYNELEAEYACFSREEAIDALLDEFSPYLRGKLFEDSDDMLLSLFQSSANGCTIEMKERTAIQSALVEAYDSVKGSAYNNCLTFSPQLIKIVVRLLRSYERFQCTVIVGPSGSGKHAAVKLLSLYLNVTLQECPDNLEDFKATLHSGYLNAIKGEQLMIYVALKDRASALDAFELLDSLLYYGDLPHLISDEERSSQLFGGDQVEEYGALCDEGRYKDAQDEKIFKIQDNLHVVVDLSAELFEALHIHTPQLLIKSGLISCHPWSKQVLEAMARERLGVLLSTTKTEFPLGAVCKAFAALHIHMSTQSADRFAVLSTQYLDVISLFPDLYTRLHKKLVEAENNLKAGIQCVERSNGYIKQLADDISVKEPEMVKLATEIEQLNKRLTQERINLDKASKAFRRKEVAARKKSEETQELAEDAHKNLEAALPSLEAAMQALTSIDKAEFLELRQVKSPPEVIQQVMEAVCTLLGVKADWATAKQILLDPYFQQKMIDIEKENIPEQSVKKIRRYTDSVRFVPDEIAKVSKAAAAMCMWVRAIDLYMKIFKSIEPKRMKLMQAESELAELMSALREETDRVAHTETTIASIQSTMADRAKRRTAVEALVRQTNSRLERSQVLSYALEEECKRWRDLLSDTEEKRKVLCGEAVVMAMTAVYGCRHGEDKRALLARQWRGIVERFAITTSPKVSMLEEFFRDQRLASWLSRYPVYNENYMSLLSSNKWTILQDPNDLSIAYLQSQNPSMVTIDFSDKNLVETLRHVVTKGQEVLVTNFHLPYPPALADIFERKLKESVHAFVGLIGVPYLRKENRVTIGGQEIACNSKFLLAIHTGADMEVVGDLTKHFNIVRFEYCETALLKRLTELSMQAVGYDHAAEYAEHVSNIEELERSVTERKTAVLGILIGAGEEFIDSVDLVASLKEAKAKVFESQNDLVIERKRFALLADAVAAFNACAVRVKCFLDLCDVIRAADPSFEVTPNSVFSIMKNEAFSGNGSQLYGGIANRCLEKVILSVLPKHRLKLHVFAALIEVLPLEVLGDAVRELRRCVCLRADLRSSVDLLLQKHDVAVSPNVEAFLRDKIDRTFQMEVALPSEILRLSEEGNPITLLGNEASDKTLTMTDFVSLLNRKAGNSRPPEYFCGRGSTVQEINDVIRRVSAKGRWLVLDGVAGSPRAHLDQIIATAGGGVFLISRHGVRTGACGMRELHVASVALPEHAPTRRAIMEELLTTREVESRPAKKRCVGSLVRFHIGISEVLNASLPLRMVEIMIEKCAASIMSGLELESKGETVAKEVAKAAGHVYEIDDDLALSVWKRVIL